jgi:carboxyl-terminal processing protease
LIRGPAGSTVVLTVLHPDEESPVEIPVQRGHIDIDSVMWARVPGTEMVQIQITQFATDTGRELKNALEEIQAERDAGKPVAGIMLDLRNNPGGYLQEALRVAGEFLDKGDIIVHERDAQGKITTHRSLATGMAADLPLVILVNQGSASAAEIVAGALQDNGRGKIVGMPTVGTGTVLHPFTLSDGSVVRLGVANWLTPHFSLIKGQGIEPDVRIDQETSVEMMSSLLLETLSPEEVRLHADRQFQAALLWLNVRHQPDESMTATQPAAP